MRCAVFRMKCGYNLPNLAQHIITCHSSYICKLCKWSYRVGKKNKTLCQNRVGKTLSYCFIEIYTLFESNVHWLIIENNYTLWFDEMFIFTFKFYWASDIVNRIIFIVDNNPALRNSTCVCYKWKCGVCRI